MEFADTCPTVQIVSDVSPGGFIVINEYDLTDEHVIFGVEVQKKRGPKPKVSDEQSAQELE